MNLDEVAELPSWQPARGSRSPASLKSQIRREIKTLLEHGLDVVETPHDSLLGGPFRLKPDPSKDAADLHALGRIAPTLVQETNKTPKELLDWLEAAKPVWRAAFFFDKPDEFIQDELDASVDGNEPTLRSILLITRIRKLRALGRYEEAERAVSEAFSLLMERSNDNVRTFLEASLHLQRGWNCYQDKKWKAAETATDNALKILRGSAGLALLGHVLTLRSLLRRRQGRFDESLADLARASECFVVEVNLYGLFSIYHNLSCLLAEQAASERGRGRRTLLIDLAISCAEKSQLYCDRYGVGQNSLISKIHLAALYLTAGKSEKSALEASAAYGLARDRKNPSDAILAHYNRAKALATLGRPTELLESHKEFLKDFGESEAWLYAEQKATRTFIRLRALVAIASRNVARQSASTIVPNYLREEK